MKVYFDTNIVLDILLKREPFFGTSFDVLEILSLADTTAQDIFNAKHLNMPDYEDAVIASIAFRENASYIVTRNIADYANSPVPAITPADFIAGLA